MEGGREWGTPTLHSSPSQMGGSKLEGALFKMGGSYTCKESGEWRRGGGVSVESRERPPPQGILGTLKRYLARSSLTHLDLAPHTPTTPLPLVRGVRVCEWSLQTLTLWG